MKGFDALATSDAGEAVERPRSSEVQLTTLRWLDALKGIAILAVVFDHAFIVDDYLLWKHCYFAVSWFIFLAGVSNTISARRRDYRPPTGTVSIWKRRLQTIMGPYLWASILAYVVLNLNHLSPLAFVHEILLFHALPPLYFIALLLQLLAVFPLLYWALYRAGWWGRLAALAGSVFVGSVLSHMITFPWVLGAHYFLGASFLYLFLLGMLAAPLMTQARAYSAAWLLICLPALFWGERIVERTNGAVMTHPPSNVLVVYAVALLGAFYVALRAFPRALPSRLFSYLGRHSLDIFLYHYLFLTPFLHFRHEAWTGQLGFVQGQVVLVLISIPLAIAASVLTARLSGRLGRGLLRRARLLRLRLDPGPKAQRRTLPVERSDGVRFSDQESGVRGPRSAPSPQTTQP